MSEHSSKFNYLLLKKNPRQLALFLKELEDVSGKDFEKFSNNQKLAFLINAYNAFTIDLIIQSYPVKSIKDIGLPLFGPWKRKFIPLFGKSFSLDNIEHDLIRKNFRDSRIHFALVCASRGCPRLTNFSYTGQTIEDDLEVAAKVFLNDKKRNYYDEKTHTFFLSPLFKWYRSDFEVSDNDIKTFVLKYMKIDSENRNKLDKDKAEIIFLDYDWNLNE